MKFEDQVADLRVVTITEPRTFIQWVNTEQGRDSNDCYERIDSGLAVYYINKRGNGDCIGEGDEFFNVLESMYNNYK